MHFKFIASGFLISSLFQSSTCTTVYFKYKIFNYCDKLLNIYSNYLQIAYWNPAKGEKINRQETYDLTQKELDADFLDGCLKLM